MSLSQRYGKGHQASPIGIDMHNVVLVAITDGVQHHPLNLVVQVEFSVFSSQLNEAKIVIFG